MSQIAFILNGVHCLRYRKDCPERSITLHHPDVIAAIAVRKVEERQRATEAEHLVARELSSRDSRTNGFNALIRRVRLLLDGGLVWLGVRLKGRSIPRCLHGPGQAWGQRGA